MARACKHTELQLDVSPHAQEAGFSRPTSAKRRAAATPSGRAPKTSANNNSNEASSFPGPLLLPDDALGLDPDEPPQSLLSWTREDLRNRFTAEKKTIYVAPVPTISAQLSSARTWVVPCETAYDPPIQPPKTRDIIAYLAAFYHPLPVKLLPGKISFLPWTTSAKPNPTYLGLQLGQSITRIRTRACPDGVFPRQLNLNDILDAAIEALPSDAYALTLLTDHDLYEDDDDDFCCGRAYGNSRVAVVSSARYHPGVDEGVVDRRHMWPASHCAQYVEDMCTAKGQKVRMKGAAKMGDMEETPIGAAIKAAMEVGEGDLYGLWFSRVARTVSHELGHCLCLDHCSYYACVMQSTAGMAEDVRQPPYLCPVCLAKVSRAIMEVTPGAEETRFVKERYEALRRFCEGWLGVGMFAGYHAWLGKRMETIGGTAE